MAGNGRGAMRPQGRSPPFLLIGLCVALVILGFNYWSLSYSNKELALQLSELQDKLKLTASKRLSAERRGEAMVDELKRCQTRVDVAKSEAAKMESELMSNREQLKGKEVELTSVENKINLKVDEVKKGLKTCEENSNGIKQELEKLKEENGILKSASSAGQVGGKTCTEELLNQKKSILNIIEKALGPTALQQLSQAGFDIGGYSQVLAVKLNDGKNQVTTKPEKENPFGMNVQQPNQGQLDAAKPNPGQPDDAAKPNPGQPDDAAKPNPGQPDDAAKPNPGQPDDAAKPNPGQPNDAAKPNPGLPDDAAKPNPGLPDDAAKPNPGQPDAAQPNPGQLNPGQPGANKPNPGQLSSNQDNPIHARMAEEHQNQAKPDDAKMLENQKQNEHPVLPQPQNPGDGLPSQLNSIQKIIIPSQGQPPINLGSENQNGNVDGKKNESVSAGVEGSKVRSETTKYHTFKLSLNSSALDKGSINQPLQASSSRQGQPSLLLPGNNLPLPLHKSTVEKSKQAETLDFEGDYGEYRDELQKIPGEDDENEKHAGEGEVVHKSGQSLNVNDKIQAMEQPFKQLPNQPDSIDRMQQNMQNEEEKLGAENKQKFNQL